ncbi:hypothetical protein IU500_12420 [Nocardia terpenica]|uniref:phage tail termination protein n=1 Tax=Nocardia terpenica TaxID=455432 RepID=UPI0018937B5C|nr:hypothetical protein [Nocardia terpenica]MBF6063018.1 hypothetical protein [Nocardia terpenica]MBF6104847.1 hypothetical protein [Nocardia terpenica]MBF6112716.1 hypothetical protein [Nocardia terpenica]MBF6118575.1 hypothetical protein [Nocardia terpenica]MBF6155054.1 hypothetical protein [Nocardia terpenica]
MVALLDPIASSDTVMTAATGLPCFQVNRVGGADDGISDRPVLQVAAFAETRAQAWELAEKARQAILDAPGTLVAGVLVDDARTAVGHQQIPDIDPDDRRVVSSYVLSFRELPTI